MNPREKFEQRQRIKANQEKKRQVIQVNRPDVVITDEVLLEDYDKKEKKEE